MEGCFDRVMNVLLDINDKPDVSVYAHHAFINAIISAKVRRNKLEDAENRNLMDAWICGLTKNKWNIVTENKAVHVKNDHLILSNAGVGKHAEVFYYRECDVEDELIVRFDEIQDTAPGAIVNLFIVSKAAISCINQNIGIIRFGKMDHHFSIRCENEYKDFYETTNSNYRWMRLCKKKESMLCSISVDGSFWEDVGIIQNDLLLKQCYIGINANNLGTGLLQQYEAWMAMNYIQLFDNTQDPVGSVWLDYKMTPYKNFRYEYGYASQFLDIVYEKKSYVQKVYGSVIEALKSFLSEGYYVALPIDEYYIKNRDAYQRRHYIHHNLVYGIDTDENRLFLLGYGRKLCASVISLEEFENADSGPDNLIIYKFDPSVIPYKFSLNAFVNTLKEFLNSESSTVKFSGVMSDHPGRSGIGAIESFYDEEEKRKLFLSDNRISYIIYEHTLLMKYRIRYLQKKVLLGVNIDKLINGIEKQEKRANIIKNMVIKNQFSDNKSDICCEIFEKLQDFISEERRILEDMVVQLEAFND